MTSDAMLDRSPGRPTDERAAALALLSAATAAVAAAHGLSEREEEVLDLAACGFSTQQIAAALVVSPRTVAFHLGRIYAKTGAGSRYDLAGIVWGDPARRCAAGTRVA